MQYLEITDLLYKKCIENRFLWIDDQKALEYFIVNYLSNSIDSN